MLKSFIKTLADGFFPVIVLEAVNNKVSRTQLVYGCIGSTTSVCSCSFCAVPFCSKVVHFERFWQEAKKKGYEVYIADVQSGLEICVSNNRHHFPRQDLMKVMHTHTHARTHTFTHTHAHTHTHARTQWQLIDSAFSACSCFTVGRMCHLTTASWMLLPPRTTPILKRYTITHNHVMLMWWPACQCCATPQPGKCGSGCN